MTKAEQARLVSWRSKILQRASGEQRTVAHTCRYSASRERPNTNGSGGRRSTVTPACAIDPERPRGHPTPRRLQSSARCCIYGSNITSEPGIADYLRRSHQVSVARSTVHRLLGKHGFRDDPSLAPIIMRSAGRHSK